jgi:hypothetical protein
MSEKSESIFITCPFCKEVPVEIVPVEAFPEEGMIVTTCKGCDNFWLTIPNSEIKNLDGLTILVGLSKLPLLKRIKMRLGLDAKILRM